MTRMIELTDTLTETTQTVEASAVRRTLRAWYGEATASLAADSDLIDEFHEAINEQDDELARDLAAQLGVGFDEVATTPGY